MWKEKRNLSYPAIHTLSKLAEILQVSVEELTQVESKKENIHAIFYTTHSQREVLSMMNKIDIHTVIQFLLLEMVLLSLYLLQNKRSYD